MAVRSQRTPLRCFPTDRTDAPGLRSELGPTLWGPISGSDLFGLMRIQKPHRWDMWVETCQGCVCPFRLYSTTVLFFVLWPWSPWSSWFCSDHLALFSAVIGEPFAALLLRSGAPMAFGWHASRPQQKRPAPERVAIIRSDDHRPKTWKENEASSTIWFILVQWRE